jgi:hypothetical protein
LISPLSSVRRIMISKPSASGNAAKREAGEGMA